MAGLPLARNLCARLNTRLITRRVYESLIAAGALDGLAGHRAQKRPPSTS